MTTRRVKEGMFICCKVDGRHIGIDLDRVQEINRLVEPTEVPLMPSHVRGVVNLRGNLVTILDLDCILRGQRTQVGRNTRNVVFESANETCGFLVDGVGDVVDLEGHEPEQLSGLVPAEQRRWFSGLVQLPERLLLLLDVDEVASFGTSECGS